MSRPLNTKPHSEKDADALIQKLGLRPDPAAPGAFLAPEALSGRPEAANPPAALPYRPVEGRGGFTLYD